jgi:RNA polymerase sigma-54 factor
MLELKQVQKLQPILTQQLQQAIKLLQLSKVELLEEISQELKENPLLEAVEPAGEPESAPGDGEEAEAPEPESGDSEDIGELLERYSSSDGFEEREQAPALDYENLVRKAPNLRDHLEWQMGLSDFDYEERAVGEWIIENIDDNGYLAFPLGEIVESARKAEEQARGRGEPACVGDGLLNEASFETVLKKIQKLDPAGVGARDLKECILLQYEASGERDPIFEHLVTKYFDLFTKATVKEIEKKTGYPAEKVREVWERIKSFDPKPGRNFSDDYASPVVPDVFVVKGEDGFQVYLNEDDIPELRMSRYYLDLYRSKEVNGEARRYVRQKVKQAQWFISSIQQRQRTLFQVATSLVRFQEEFLEKGLRFLRPLNLRDVAGDLGIHESTVSRVTANKYMSTPQGIYEMKFFFPTALNDTHGGSLSNNVVMDVMREIVAGEDKRHPLSDDEIAVRLKERHEVEIARRTVAKYREIMNIPSSRERRRSD